MKTKAAEMNRPFRTGVFAAVVAGVVVGAIARVLMRLLSMAAGHNGTATLTGSVFIVAIYVVAMLPGAIVTAYTTSRWRWLVLAAGSVFLVFPAIGVASEEVGSLDSLSALRKAVVVFISVLVFATIAVVPVVTVLLADQWSDRTRRAASVAS